MSKWTKYLKMIGALPKISSVSLPQEPYYPIPEHEKAVNEVLSLLKASQHSISITGIGGIGKTTIAAEVTKKALKQGLFDDFVWVTAKLNKLIDSEVKDTSRPILTLGNLLNQIFSKLAYEDIGVDTLARKKERLKAILSST